MKDEKEKQRRGLQWYYNPVEQYRMMRYMQLKPLDPSLDLTPTYNKDNLKIGVVIGTYGATPFIDLQLHWLMKVNGIQNVLVHDDHSPESDKLAALCESYGAEFVNTKENLFHYKNIGSIGDQSCFLVGLNWAKKKNIDVLVKISRRLIACYRWIDDFKNLVLESDGIAFSSRCETDYFPIRTECFGMNVKAWTVPYVMNSIYFTIKNEFTIFAEYWYNSLSKQLDMQNYSKKYEKYRKDHFEGQLYSGYVKWTDLLGTDRYKAEGRHKDVLWHQYSKNEDYLKEITKIFGNKYDLKDLEVTEI